MKINTSGQSIGVQMASATDGSAFTGTVTVYVTGDAGTQAIGSVGSGVCTHEGNGFHTYAPAQAETNYDHIAFTFIGTGAIPSTLQVYTNFPQTVDNNVLAAGVTGFAAIDTVVDTLLSRIVGTLAAGTHNPATAAQIAVLSDWIDAGRLDAILDAIAANLVIITGADGVTLASTQGATTWEEITLSPTGNAPNIDFNGAGTGDVFTFTRSGSGNLYDAAYAADLLAAIVSGGAVLNGTNINQIMLDLANGGRTDLLIDAIKAITDQMVFTKVNELDTNTQSINGVTLVGDGTTTPMGA